MSIADNEFYKVYEWDVIKPGDKMKVEHNVSLNNADISGLTPLPLDELTRRRAESERIERAIYEQIVKSVSKWEEQAALTAMLDNAIEYAKVPPVKHSSNQWVCNEHDYHEISNAVYKMTWHVYEHTMYDQAIKAQTPVAWSLTWSVGVNVPSANHNYSNPNIAGQKGKKFTDKTAMSKYLDGRINTYSSLFNEISPPIPQGIVKFFKVNGVLLPGYSVTGKETVTEKNLFPVQPRESVLARIAADKAAKKENRGAAGENASVKERKRGSKNNAELD